VPAKVTTIAAMIDSVCAPPSWFMVTRRQARQRIQQREGGGDGGGALDPPRAEGDADGEREPAQIRKPMPTQTRWPSIAAPSSTPLSARAAAWSSPRAVRSAIGG
jgi:hypothetical protein